MPFAAPELNPYPAPVWRRFIAPAHAAARKDPPATFTVRATTPAAALEIRLLATSDGQKVVRCRFLAHGCPYTIAVGDWLAQWCEGRDQDGISDFSAEELRRALEIPEERAHCLLMAQDLLRDLTVQMA